MTDIKDLALDRDTHQCVIVPGVVLLVALSASAWLIATAKQSLPQAWAALSELNRISPLAGAMLALVALVCSLALGFLNQWVSQVFYQYWTRNKWAWDAARDQLPEILPYDAIDDNRTSTFYSQLRDRLSELHGCINGLEVRVRQKGETEIKRTPKDVASDLISAWVLCHCQPAWNEAEKYFQQHNFSIVLSTAFSFSMTFVSLAAFSRSLNQDGWAKMTALIPLICIAPACLVYRWFVIRAKIQWAQGRNLLSRVFWAAWGYRQTTPQPQPAPPA